MSVARTDARFLVPGPPRSALVLGGLRAWEEGLERSGVEVDGGSAPSRPDLVIAPGEELAAALATGTEQIVLEGAVPARALQRAGYRVRRYLSVPSLEAPLAFVPLGRKTQSEYALRRIVTPRSRLKALRNEALSLLLEHDRAPLSKLLVTVAARREPTPFIVDAVGRFGVTPDAEWLLSPGQSEAKGNVFYLFSAGSQEPDRVAKFRRAPGPIERAERERRGRNLLAAAPALIRDHAPTHVGCLQANGLDVVVETAAPGMRLPSFLLSWRPRAAKLALIERVAAWLVDIADQTAAAPAALASELRVQAEKVLPHWVGLGVPLDLVPRVSSVPAVFQHHDLAVENVVAGDDRFTVIDWEAARRHGFPLCDLVFFLADALAHTDGVSGGDAYTEHFVRLFRGELPSSAVLFKWAGHAARELRISRAAVGPLATVCWIERATWGAAPGDSITERDSPHVARARAWLRDPQLGADWRAFPG